VKKLKKTKSKNTGKGRNFGKLAQLMDMPLDVVFEVGRVLILTSNLGMSYSQLIAL
jgi:flagellar motor switch/type III secretory pathway protein FliN